MGMDYVFKCSAHYTYPRHSTSHDQKIKVLDFAEALNTSLFV